MRCMSAGSTGQCSFCDNGCSVRDDCCDSAQLCQKAVTATLPSQVGGLVAACAVEPCPAPVLAVAHVAPSVPPDCDVCILQGTCVNCVDEGLKGCERTGPPGLDQSDCCNPWLYCVNGACT